MVNNICYLICGTNAYISNNQCICIPGYSFSPHFRSCIQNQNNGVICGPNFELVNNVCVCKSGYGLVNKNCIPCPVNSYLSSSG